MRTRQNPMLVAGINSYSPVERGPVVPQVAPAPNAQRYPTMRVARAAVGAAVKRRAPCPLARGT